MKDDELFPFKYVVGKLDENIIVDGEPALESLEFIIDKEGDMYNASCDEPKLFLSAETVDLLMNKIDNTVGEMFGED